MKTVLVVDDDDAIRTFVHKALAKYGWTVLEAEDGVDGVARFMLHHPDVLLTDISMPQKDGLEMVHLLHQAGDLEGVKVIIMSGVINLTTISSADLGEVTLLSKPFTLNDLLVAIGHNNHETP